MDFQQFETKTGSEEGRFCHFTDTKTKEFLFDSDGKKKKPVGAILRGLESRTVQEAVASMQSRASSSAEIQDSDVDTATAKALVVEFVNVDRDGRPLTTSDEDLTWFFGLSSHWVQSVIAFSREPGNFLPEPKTS